MLYTYMSQVGFHETRGASNRSMHTLSPTTGLPCQAERYDLTFIANSTKYLYMRYLNLLVYAKDWVAANRN